MTSLLVVGHPWTRWAGILLVTLFALFMGRSMYESWMRLRASRRHRLEETYDIARFIFGLITAGLIIWMLLTPPPHQLTRGLLAVLSLWAIAYLALFGFLAFLLAKRRSRSQR